RISIDAHLHPRYSGESRNDASGEQRAPSEVGCAAVKVHRNRHWSLRKVNFAALGFETLRFTSILAGFLLLTVRPVVAQSSSYALIVSSASGNSEFKE